MHSLVDTKTGKDIAPDGTKTGVAKKAFAGSRPRTAELRRTLGAEARIVGAPAEAVARVLDEKAKAKARKAKEKAAQKR